jgi:hypothetical protein
MTEEEIKKYLKRHLEVYVEDEYFAGEGQYIRVSIRIDGEVIDEDSAKVYND